MRLLNTRGVSLNIFVYDSHGFKLENARVAVLADDNDEIILNGLTDKNGYIGCKYKLNGKKEYCTIRCRVDPKYGFFVSFTSSAAITKDGLVQYIYMHRDF